jgi:hypothetical protein
MDCGHSYRQNDMEIRLLQDIGRLWRHAQDALRHLVGDIRHQASAWRFRSSKSLNERPARKLPSTQEKGLYVLAGVPQRPGIVIERRHLDRLLAAEPELVRFLNEHGSE